MARPVGPGLPPDRDYPPDAFDKELEDSATCFEAIIYKIERYTCRDINIEAKLTLKFLPTDEEWARLGRLHQVEKTVKVVITE